MRVNLARKELCSQPFIKISPDMFIVITLLEEGEGKLMDWSKEKEKRYQTLMTKIEDGRYILKDGKTVFESIQENEYLEELVKSLEGVGRGCRPLQENLYSK